MIENHPSIGKTPEAIAIAMREGEEVCDVSGGDLNHSILIIPGT
jgi:hypothetical protein